MQIGLEKEFFIKANNEYVIAPAGLPYDECGFLAEARGNPFSCPTDAVFSLKSSIFKLQDAANKLNVSLDDSPLGVIPKKLKLEVARRFIKGLTKHQNLYGFECHRNKSSEHTAGIHISFTDSGTVMGANNIPVTYNRMFDWAKIFRQLDKAFAEEIKQSKRNPGFYELKPDGRIEYRSLPSNTDLDKIITVLKNIL